MGTIQDVKSGHKPLLEPLTKRNGEEQKLESGDGGLCMVLLSTFVAVCGSFVFGTCIGYTAPTQTGITEELKLSPSEYSMFGSILNFGAMTGAIASGRVADYFGRKGAMRISSIICTAGWLAIYFSLGSIPLNIGRFLTGCGIGIFSYVVPVYIAEITPKELRGTLATVNQLLIVCGISAAYVIGVLVTWRTLALSGIVPCLVLLLGLFIIPDSPRWLAMVGRKTESEAALQKLRGANVDISEEAADIQDSILLSQDLPKAAVMDLFNGNNIRFVIVGVGLMLFQQFMGINGITFYASKIFESAGASSELGSILVAGLQIVVTAIGASLVDRAGRRPLLTVSASGMLFASLLLGFSFLLKDLQLAIEIVPALAITGVLFYIGAFSLGMGAIPWVIMSEIFPINIKGTAGSLVTLVNWFGSWVVSFAFNFLMGWSSFGTFIVDALFCAAAIVFILKFVPETKGRTLEEIHASMK